MKKIIISGEIGWDIKPADIRKQLDEAAGNAIDVHIASPGGSVFSGIEIFNTFRDYRRSYPGADMGVTIKGVAASMASYLAVNPAFNRKTAEDNAVLMIHNAWGTISGDYREMEKFREFLNNLNSLLAGAYAARMGKSISEVRKLMDAESWFYGEEIKAAGFVDDILVTGQPSNKTAAITTAQAKFKALSVKFTADMKVAASAIHDAASALAMLPLDSEADFRSMVDADRAALGLSPIHTAAPGLTPPADGVVRSESDYNAELAAAKARLGLG